MKGAAKLLNGGDENQDWTSLAKLMGMSLEPVLFLIIAGCLLFLQIKVVLASKNYVIPVSYGLKLFDVPLMLS